MNRATLCALAAIFALPAPGQDLTGTWQGILTGTNPEMRMVLKITKDANTYQGMFYNLENGRQAPLGAIAIQGSSVKIAIPGVGANFEGRINGDGNSIAGNISQGTTPLPLPLPLARATPQTAWEIPPPPAAPKPMAEDARLEFEVATIKPADPNRTGRSAGFSNRRFQINNYTLLDMITFAYEIHPRQVTELPSWAETERFDIVAQPVADGQPNARQLKRMLQVLLTDRFNLAFHPAKKELSVYAISVNAGGHKLTPTSSNDQLPTLAFRGRGNLPARNATVANLANTMQNSVLDRPVLDQTGISGKFDFMLVWTPDEFQFAQAGPRPPTPPAAPDGPPDLFTAMREQLGLKLEATKAPVEVFVIDKADRPSEN